MSLNLSTALH